MTVGCSKSPEILVSARNQKTKPTARVRRAGEADRDPVQADVGRAASEQKRGNGREQLSSQGKAVSGREPGAARTSSSVAVLLTADLLWVTSTNYPRAGTETRQ
jgi:hypothetical protein